MGGKSIILQSKQERIMRTRWTPDLDKLFADLVVEQIQLGNRPNDVFDKKTWNHIRDEFNKQTALNFNSNQLRKHLDVLRTRFLGIKSALYSNDNDFLIGDSCSINFEVWDDGYEAPPQLESNKVKECPIFEQLSIIFAESRADGKYAQSSHYEELDKSLISGMDMPLPSTDDLLVNSFPGREELQAYPPSSSMFAKPCVTSAQNVNESIPEKKRKHSSEKVSDPGQAKNDQDLNEIMAKAMLEMLDSSTLRRSLKPEQKETFTISNCIKVLDETEAEEGMDGCLYFAALDFFEDPNMRETFISLKSNKIRLAWLQGKWSKTKSGLS